MSSPGLSEDNIAQLRATDRRMGGCIDAVGSGVPLSIQTLPISGHNPVEHTLQTGSITEAKRFAHSLTSDAFDSKCIGSTPDNSAKVLRRRHAGKCPGQQRLASVTERS